MTITQSLWYWRLAIFECVMDAYIAGAMVWMSAIADKEWSDLTPTARHAIWVLVSISVLKSIKSFVSTTVQVLKEAKPKAEAVQAQKDLAKQTEDAKVETVTTPVTSAENKTPKEP